MKTILIRVTEDFKKEIESQAQEMQISTSAFIRLTLKERLSK